ncbi:MAG: polyprenyl diphosphate synthase, partial [Acidobacteriota bacterium]|nr:polyprenyl diphosphate synthase [Acidobacteriota bacterium]
TVRRVVESAADLDIGTLTLYAFSSDNWHRPAPEVNSLMKLMRDYLAEETMRCVSEGLRVSVIGRRDRLHPDLVAEIQRTERATRGGRRLELRFAVDYSSRDAILAAAAQGGGRGGLDRHDFHRRLLEVIHSSPTIREVDLLIRTGGEKRLSDFLLWESAYAELHFCDRLWPDFRPRDLAAALADFRRRDRRYGALSDSIAAPGPATAA